MSGLFHPEAVGHGIGLMAQVEIDGQDVVKPSLDSESLFGLIISSEICHGEHFNVWEVRPGCSTASSTDSIWTPVEIHMPKARLISPLFISDA